MINDETWVETCPGESPIGLGTSAMARCFARRCFESDLKRGSRSFDEASRSYVEWECP
jgi:hypothetical protein